MSNGWVVSSFPSTSSKKKKAAIPNNVPAKQQKQAPKPDKNNVDKDNPKYLMYSKSKSSLKRQLSDGFIAIGDTRAGSSKVNY